MNKFNISLLLLFIVSNLCGQDIASNADLKWVKTKHQTLGTSNKMIGHDNDGYYVLHEDSKSNYFIENYNEDLNKLEEISLEIETEGRKLKFHSTLKLKNKICLFHTFEDPENKNWKLYLTTISLNTFELNNDTRIILEEEKAGDDFDSDFELIMSKDSSKMLFLNSFFLQKGKRRFKQFLVHVFDDNFNPLWNGNVNMPFMNKSLKIKDKIIDNNGKIYITATYYSKKTEGSKFEDYFYNFSLDEKNSKLQIQPIISEKINIRDCKFSIMDNGEILIFGLYTEYTSKRYIKGTFSIKYNFAARSIVSENIYEFEEDYFYQRPSFIKTKDKSSFERNGFYHRTLSLLMKKNGEFLLVSERHWNAKSGKVFLLNFSSTGELISKRMIDKSQTYIYRDYFSYAMMNSNDKVIFVFNGLVRQEDNKGKERFVNGKKSFRRSIVMAVLDSEGELSEQIPLMSSKESKFMLIPRHFLELNENGMLLYLTDEDYGYLGKLNIEE